MSLVLRCDRHHVCASHRRHPHARFATGGRFSCPPHSPSYHHVLAACAEVSLRTLELALAYAWLRQWLAGLARGLVWAACVCPLHQQRLGYLWFSRNCHHYSPHLVLSERTHAAPWRRDQQRNRGRGKGEETGRHGSAKTRNCWHVVRCTPNSPIPTPAEQIAGLHSCISLIWCGVSYLRDIFRWRLDPVVTRGSITAQRR